MNTKLIIGSILGLLLIRSANSNAYPGANYAYYSRGYGYNGQYTQCGGCYGGGGGYGCGGYNYSSVQTAVTLGGVANIIGALTPIVCTAMQPSVVQQGPNVYIIQPNK